MKRIGIFLISALFLAGCSSVNETLDSRLDLAALTTDPGYTGELVGTVDSVTPSTNDANKTNGWAYVELVEARLGEVDLKFVQPRAFAACFEHRSDLEAPDYTDPHYNPDVTDGLWEFTCQNASDATLTITADEFVDVRMVFGAESDERFDWTRFYVLTLDSKDQCKDGAWEGYGFKNQGQCIASVVANGNSVH